MAHIEAALEAALAQLPATKATGGGPSKDPALGAAPNTGSSSLSRRMKTIGGTDRSIEIE